MRTKRFFTVIILSALFVFFASYQSVLAGEQVIKLTVPGCA